MKIAIVGTRGIPAAYGGFETLRVGALDAAGRARPRRHGLLPARPHRRDVPVPAGRPAAVPAVPPGQVPGDGDATRRFRSSTAWSAATTRCGSATPRTPSCRGIPRLRGTRVVLNVDGIERQRAQVGAGRAGSGTPSASGSRSSTRTRSCRTPRSSATTTVERYGASHGHHLRRAAPGPRARRRTSRARARPDVEPGRLHPLRQPPGAREPGRPRDPRVPRVPGDMPAADRGRRAVRRGVQGSACASSRPPIRGSG